MVLIEFSPLFMINHNCALVGESDFNIIELVNKVINNQDISKVPGLLKHMSRG